MDISEEIKKAESKIEKMVSYLIFKVEAKDWHAVADAAMDIRELEERKRTLKEIKE